MITFKIQQHSVYPERQVVEVWRNGTMISVIYPYLGNGIHIVSKYLNNCVIVVFNKEESSPHS